MRVWATTNSYCCMDMAFFEANHSDGEKRRTYADNRQQLWPNDLDACTPVKPHLHKIKK